MFSCGFHKAGSLCQSRQCFWATRKHERIPINRRCGSQHGARAPAASPRRDGALVPCRVRPGGGKANARATRGDTLRTRGRDRVGAAGRGGPIPPSPLDAALIWVTEQPMFCQCLPLISAPGWRKDAQSWRERAAGGRCEKSRRLALKWRRLKSLGSRTPGMLRALLRWPLGTNAPHARPLQMWTFRKQRWFLIETSHRQKSFWLLSKPWRSALLGHLPTRTLWAEPGGVQSSCGLRASRVPRPPPLLSPA